MWVIGIPLFVGIGLFAAGGVIAARWVFSRWGSLPARVRAHMVTVLLALAVFLGCMANFAAFFTVSLAISGDASDGKVEGGRYYVSSRGRLTEVSPGVWKWSLFHVRSLWVTHPLGVLALVVMIVSGRVFGVGGASPLTIRGTPEGGPFEPAEKEPP